jgi:hypothetical protein
LVTFDHTTNVTRRSAGAAIASAVTGRPAGAVIRSAPIAAHSSDTAASATAASSTAQNAICQRCGGAAAATAPPAQV